MSLAKKYRPKSLADVCGQPVAVRTLTSLVERNAVPHFILLSGPSGVGKTTIARILKRVLKCKGDGVDWHELNCADFRGIDMVREIREHVGMRPLAGKSRIWLIDEAHQLTKDAQHAMLKLLEDMPEHVYFIFATTHPQGLLPTVRTRATEIRLGLVDDQPMRELIGNVLEHESVRVSNEVIDALIESAEGSPRKALVLLDQVIGLPEDEQLAGVSVGVASPTGIELAKLLCRGKTSWPAVAKLIKLLDEDPEAVRRLILAYASAILLNGGGKWPFQVVATFERSFAESGKAGLVAACYELVCGADR